MRTLPFPLVALVCHVWYCIRLCTHVLSFAQHWTNANRSGAARCGGSVSWKHFSHRCAVQFDAAAVAVSQHTALLRRMANIYNGNLVRAAAPAVLLCLGCCLGLHSDFEFLTSRSSFSTPPALHCYSALVYYIYTLQMYSVEGAISPCHLPGQKRSSLAIHNGGLHIH